MNNRTFKISDEQYLTAKAWADEAGPGIASLIRALLQAATEGQIDLRVDEHGQFKVVDIDKGEGDGQ